MRKKKTYAKKRLHKTVISVLAVLMILFGTAIECKAEQTDAEESVGKEVDQILDGFYESIPTDTDKKADLGEISESVGVKHILRTVIMALRGGSGELGAFLLTLLGVCLMSALASLAKGELGAISTRAVGIVASLMMLERLIFLLRGALGALEEINAFFSSVIPVTLAVNSLGITPTTASVQAIGMGVTLSVYSYLCSGILSGVVSVIFIGASASAIDPLFTKLSRCVKNIFLSLVGILSVLIGASFSLQTALSASADSALMRSARYAVSSTVPIVGSAISGVLGVAVGSVSYARGIVGGGSIAVILSLMLSPLVMLVAYRLCLKAAVFFTSVTSLDGCESIFTPFLGALDALIAVYAMTSVVYIGELSAFLKGGVGLAQ